MRPSRLLAAVLAAFVTSPAQAAKATECTKIGICYCVNDELSATIASKVDRFRQTIAGQRKAGKSVGYLSVPLSTAGRGLAPADSEAPVSGDYVGKCAM